MRELGTWLAKNHPEIADWYADIDRDFRALDVGMQFLPTEASVSKDVVSKAVVRSLHILIPKDQREVLTRMRRSRKMKEKWDFTSPAWFEHCRAAAQRRHSLGIGVNVVALLSGRGRTPWSCEEKQKLIDLSRDVRSRDFSEIAEVLNVCFHGGQPIRYENSCRSMVAQFRRKKKQS